MLTFSDLKISIFSIMYTTFWSVHYENFKWKDNSIDSAFINVFFHPIKTKEATEKGMFRRIPAK